MLLTLIPGVKEEEIPIQGLIHVSLDTRVSCPSRSVDKHWARAAGAALWQPTSHRTADNGKLSVYFYFVDFGISCTFPGLPGHTQLTARSAPINCTNRKTMHTPHCLLLRGLVINFSTRLAICPRRRRRLLAENSRAPPIVLIADTCATLICPRLGDPQVATWSVRITAHELEELVAESDAVAFSR